MSHKLIENITLLVGGTLGCVSHVLGGWDVLLKAMLLFTVLDFITGWLKSIFCKNLSSQIGFKGLIKKVFVFIVIAVANITQALLNQTIPLRETIIMFYILNEALSIVENAAYFIPIPERLKKVLLQLNQENNKDIGHSDNNQEK